MSPSVHVLGVAQDGGHPQPGCLRPCCRGATVRHLPSCLGIADPASGQRWIIDATPAFPEQLARHGGVDGIVLTHAHMGHYTGLMYLGREAMDARDLPLYVQPRMAAYLSENGPWRQLVDRGNVALHLGTRW